MLVPPRAIRHGPMEAVVLWRWGVEAMGDQERGMSPQ